MTTAPPFRLPSLTASLAFSIALASLLGARVARGEDVDPLLEVLEQSVVSGASRSVERLGDAPAMSSVITSEQLRRFGIHHLDEAINYLSLGMFSHDRLSTAEVGARGLTLTRDTNSHVLVVLDGMVVNEQGGGAVYLQDIPIEVIDHVEVILGPGSVLYGGQAMLGVINVVTRAPNENQGVHATASLGASPPLNASGRIKAPTFSTLGHDGRFSIGGARTLRLLGAPLGVTGLVDYADFKGPEITFAPEPLPRRADGTPVDIGPRATPGSWGGPVNNQWYRRTAGAYVKLDLGDITWSTRGTTTRSAMPQMDLFENRVGGVYDDERNANHYALLLSNLTWHTRLSAGTSGMVRAYFGYSNTGYDRVSLTHDVPIPGVPLGIIDPEQCPTGPLGACRKETRLLSRWIGAELVATHDWRSDGAYTTMVGVDARQRTAAYEFVTYDLSSELSYGSNPANTRWHGGGNKRANEYAVGPYVQQVAKLTKVVAVNAGIRLDYDTRVETKYLRDAVSPRVALILTPTEHLSVKGIYSTAFRAPSFLELYAVEGRLLPNPNGLQPETVSSYEVIGTARSGPHTVTVGGFFAQWKDLIELRMVKAVAPSVSRYENVSSIRNYGTNATYETVLFNRRLRPGINVTVARALRELSADQEARNAAWGTGDSVPITVAPSVYGNARLTYSFDEDETTVLALAGGYFGRRIADQAYYGGDASNLTPRPESAPMLAVRAVLTGVMPGWDPLGYSLGADYTFGNSQPYVVGPDQGMPRYLVAAPAAAELAPVNRLTVFMGLELHLGGASRTHAAGPFPEPKRKEPEPVPAPSPAESPGAPAGQEALP